jgi:hypothetical protein
VIVNSFSWWFIGVTAGPEDGTVSPRGQRNGRSPRMGELVFVGDRCKTKKAKERKQRQERVRVRASEGLTGWDGMDCAWLCLTGLTGVPGPM